MTMESDDIDNLETDTTPRANRNPEDFVVIDRVKPHVIPFTEFTVNFKSLTAENPEQFN